MDRAAARRGRADESRERPLDRGVGGLARAERRASQLGERRVALPERGRELRPVARAAVGTVAGHRDRRLGLQQSGAGEPLRERSGRRAGQHGIQAGGARHSAQRVRARPRPAPAGDEAHLAAHHVACGVRPQPRTRGHALSHRQQPFVGQADVSLARAERQLRRRADPAPAGACEQPVRRRTPRGPGQVAGQRLLGPRARLGLGRHPALGSHRHLGGGRGRSPRAAPAVPVPRAGARGRRPSRGTRRAGAAACAERRTRNARAQRATSTPSGTTQAIAHSGSIASTTAATSAARTASIERTASSGSTGSP